MCMYVLIRSLIRRSPLFIGHRRSGPNLIGGAMEENEVNTIDS